MANLKDLVVAKPLDLDVLEEAYSMMMISSQCPILRHVGISHIKFSQFYGQKIVGYSG